MCFKYKSLFHFDKLVIVQVSFKDRLSNGLLQNILFVLQKGITYFVLVATASSHRSACNPHKSFATTYVMFHFVSPPSIYRLPDHFLPIYIVWKAFQPTLSVHPSLCLPMKSQFSPKISKRPIPTILVRM